METLTDVSYHVEQSKKLNELCSFILNELASRKKNEITKEWLTKCIDRFFHPEKYLPKTRKKQKSFYELSEEYLSKKEFSVSHTKSIRVLVRDVARYEGFVRATDNSRKNFVFDIDKVRRDDIEDFFDYLRNEKDLSEEYPTIFAKLLKQYPVGIKRGQCVLVVRGDNTIVKLAKKLKAFFVWLYESGKTTNSKRLHDDVLHISKKPLRGELSGFLSIYQAEASCISPKVY